jgi:hypothetical protein
MMSDIKGFKYLRAGSECAIERREPFGRGVSYSLATIKAFDPFAGIIEIVGSAYTFSTDGYQLGRTGGEPRRRLSWRDIPPDETVLHFRGGGGIDWLVVLGSA